MDSLIGTATNIADINYLLGKVRILCDIRDNNSTCEYLDTHEICKLIGTISSD